MNILFYGWGYPPRGSGIGAYAQNMARALACAGHRTIVATGEAQGFPARSLCEGVEIHRLYREGEIGGAAAGERVLRLAREESVDLIEGADHLGECAGLLGFGKRPPVMVKLHSCDALDVLVESQILYPWQRLTVGAALWRQRRRVRAERRLIRDADLACTPSRRLRDEVVKQGLRPAGSLAVVPNPLREVDLDAGAESAAPSVLFVGRLDFGKGIQYLPAIARRVGEASPGAVMQIAGADSYARGLGSMRRWLERRMGGAGMEVNFLGHLPERELDAAYRGAWVVIVPSRWDNFPGAVLDAMAHGKAVVASPHGGMPEMLEGTDCPVEDPGSPEFSRRVVELIADGRRREAAGLSARKKAEESYSPTAVARAYIEHVLPHL